MIQATQTSLHSTGNRTAANLLKESIKTPTRALKIKKAYDNSVNLIIPYTNDEALAFFLDNNLTKQQYINIRLSAKKKNVNIYPTYEQILEAKRKCYPKNIQVKETACEINIQDLLDHTIVRIFTIPSLPKIENRMHNFEIIYKWGCDGSSGQSQYKQRYFFENTTNDVCDGDLFLFSLVPLQLQCDVENNKTVLWKNPRPSSTRFCRPIKYMFKKETAQTTLEELKIVEDQIKIIVPTSVKIDDNNINVKHTLVFTMIDGKVIKLI